MPAATAASEKSRALRSWSTTIWTSGLPDASAITRAILSGVTTGEVISSFVSPLRSMTSASLTFAQQMPTAPRSIWRWAMMGHLCVLA
jgi:hypothetical protein